MNTDIRVLVTGDRNWREIDIIQAAIVAQSPSLVIEGGARGADTMARRVCELLSIPCKEIKANWQLYGKAAGPIRNREMLGLEPTIILAFHNDLNESKGTRDMVCVALKKGYSVRLYTEKQPLGFPVVFIGDW